LKHKCTEHLNAAQILARASYKRINDAAVEFFRDLGGADKLPKGFDVHSEGWQEAEQQIDEVAAAFDIEKTVNLCHAYERRAMAYFAAWRKKLEKRKEAA